MTDSGAAKLAAKLAPEAMRQTLVRSGALLTGYELVKATIVEGVREFFLQGFDEDGYIYSPQYTTGILRGANNVFENSMAWLVDQDALTPRQAVAMATIREHRNETAHELANILVNPDAEIRTDLLRELHGIMRSLDRFFGGIVADTSEQLYGQEVDYDTIRSGSGLLFDYLIDMANLDPPPEAVSSMTEPDSAS